MDKYQPIQLNGEVLHAAIIKKGFKSVEAFASSLGLHRNTVGNYLQGASALPEALTKVLDALELSPTEVFEGGAVRRKVPGLALTGLLSQLQKLSPAAAFVLFGSRARAKHKKFSDYDIGIFRTEGIPFKEYSKLLTATDEFNEKSNEQAQLVNLSNADQSFLKEIRKDLLLLGGDFESWVNLLKTCGVVVHE